MAASVGISDLTSGFSKTEQVASAPKRPLTSQRPSAKPQYMFIHTVRFWSMLAIVMMHGANEAAVHGIFPVPAFSFFVQIFKFGTIGFFLISGFLLGDRLPAGKPLSYLQRRASRLMPPWAIWFALEVCFTELARVVHHWGPGMPISTAIREDALWCFTGTALWFVPNFMVAISCVVLLRRWLNNLRLGAALLAANLFYTVNVYTHWIPSKHSEAVFGFAFYVWLGAWCALRKDKLHRWAAALSGSRLVLCAILAVGAALIESRVLLLHGSDDFLNTLRLGNQVYSVLIVILLLRVQRVTWPRFVNVAADTYGIYLTHTMALSVTFAVFARIAFHNAAHIGPLAVVGMWLVLSPAAYVSSLLLTKCFAATRLAWVVGATSPDSGAASQPLRTGLETATAATTR